MRKIFITSILILLTICSYSQVKLGLKASPNLSWNRVIDPSDSISNKGVSLRTGGGAFLDFMFSDNYALNTGLIYTTKSSGTKAIDTLNNTIKRDISLQYLEIPVTLKLFTNEIGADMRLYFQVGGAINMNLAAKVNKKKSEELPDGTTFDHAKAYNLFDLSAVASAGMEMQMGGDTWFFSGITYDRGLINALNKDYRPTNGFEFYSEYVSIDVGLKF